MLPNKNNLKNILAKCISQSAKRGFDVQLLQEKLKHLPDSYDAIVALADELELAKRDTVYPYEQPESLEEIRSASKDFSGKRIGRKLSVEEASARVEAAFLGGLAGCMLGKPIECNPTLSELREAAEAVGEWPIKDYIPLALLGKLGRKHDSYTTTCRENIRFVTPDDDINYIVIGMRMLEKHGLNFTATQLASYWLENIPPLWTWGPERKFLLEAGLHFNDGLDDGLIQRMSHRMNPQDEACGAAIRVDAYGYAAPGLPSLAAELAWRDASMTHRITGVYASMFVAAAVATAPVVEDPLDIFRHALAQIPSNSYFAFVMRDCFQMVIDAKDYLEGYTAINQKYGEYGHCQLYQECGQLINTAKFAKNTEEAICMQVSQGCDTDCFGKIAGSIMGGFFGPGYLPEKWISVFNDDFRVVIAEFFERSIRNVATRIGALPQLTLHLEEWK